MNVMKSYVRLDDFSKGASANNSVYSIIPGMSKKKYRVCYRCKEKYEYHNNWVHYIVGKKEFCSWNCKCAYLREKKGVIYSAKK